MKWNSRKGLYLFAGTLGLVAGIFLLGTFNFQIFGEEQTGNPKDIQEAMTGLITKQLTDKVSDQLQNQDPCLEKVIAAPKTSGITYSYYDVTLPKEIYSLEKLRVVILDTNDFQVTLKYSNADSCINRPNNDRQEIAKKFASGGPYIFNPTTNLLVNTGRSEDSLEVETQAISRVNKAHPVGNGSFKESLASDNIAFDTTRCCRLTAVDTNLSGADEVLNAEY